MLSDEELDRIREVYKDAPDYNYTVQLMKEVEELKRIIQTIKADALEEAANRIEPTPVPSLYPGYGEFDAGKEAAVEVLRDMAYDIRHSLD